MKKVPFTSCVQEAHVRRMNNKTVVFEHANACTSMCPLVKIHNSYVTSLRPISLPQEDLDSSIKASAENSIFSFFVNERPLEYISCSYKYPFLG